MAGPTPRGPDAATDWFVFVVCWAFILEKYLGTWWPHETGERK
jgi:hypothetical protein